MSTGIKVLLIGCVSVIVIGVVAVGVGGYFAKRWVQNKSEQVGNLVGSKDSEYGRKVAQLSEQYPFKAPDNGTITEEQVERFLAVRKSIYSVYKGHEAEFKEMSDKHQELSGAMKGLEILQEARMTQANALQEQKMSPEEYAYMVSQVYISLVGSKTKDALGDKSFKQASTDALKKQIEELDKQIADPNSSEEVKKSLKTVRDGIQSQLDTASKTGAEIDEGLNKIPQQNIEIFKKHEKEIEQYSMAGLELIGL